MENTILNDRRISNRLYKKFLMYFSEFQIPKSSESSNSYTQDISYEGVLFESTREFAIGTLLKLNIQMPGWEKFKDAFIKSDWDSVGKPLVALGNVVRKSKKADGTGHYNIGVKFVNLYEGDKEALKRFLDNKDNIYIEK